jgi:hypothetical protein
VLPGVGDWFALYRNVIDVLDLFDMVYQPIGVGVEVGGRVKAVLDGSLSVKFIMGDAVNGYGSNSVVTHGVAKESHCFAIKEMFIGVVLLVEAFEIAWLECSWHGLILARECLKVNPFPRFLRSKK